MAYRDDLGALQARHAALEAEVAERTRVRDEVARMLAETRALEETERRLADLAAGGPARRHRRRIRIAAAATVLALVSAGVTYRLARPERDRFEEVIAQFSIWVDQTCSCTDAACTKQVSDAMMRWAQTLPKEVRDAPPNLDKAHQQRLMDLADRMVKCTAHVSSPPQ